MPVGVSVVVPTVDRKEALLRCIASLEAQTVGRDLFEVIIVDNGSSDGTADVVRTTSESTGLRLRYFVEQRKGLLWARHAGIHAAAEPIVAFLDDDATPDPQWVGELIAAYTHDNVMVAGGPISLRWDREPPSWVLRYVPLLGQLDYGPLTRELTRGEFLCGSNISARKTALVRVGGFNPDQVGSHLVGDGEVGLCRKLTDAGIAMQWLPNAHVTHWQVAGVNGTEADIGRRYWNNGVAQLYGNLQSRTLPLSAVPASRRRHMARYAKHALLARALRFVARDAARQHWFNSQWSSGWVRFATAILRTPSLADDCMRRDWLTESGECGETPNA